MRAANRAEGKRVRKVKEDKKRKRQRKLQAWEWGEDIDSDDDDYVINDVEEGLNDASEDFSIEDELSDEDCNVLPF